MVKKKNNKADGKSKLNGWHVLMRFVDGIFDLVNTNRIYPAFGLILLAIVSLTIWRLPPDELANIIKVIVADVVIGKGFLISLVVVSNLGWIYLFNRMRDMYKNEIDRLSNIRSELIHNSGRNVIEDHRSSERVSKESILIPASARKQEDEV
jgi:hypothetical protein